MGLVHECDTRTLSSYTARCNLLVRGCLTLSRHDYAEQQRALAERACMIDGRFACVMLAAYYAMGDFEQPTPGRARYLADRFCTPAERQTPKHDCYNISDVEKELEQLP